jgi:filamentous hemagglutinin family protein
VPGALKKTKLCVGQNGLTGWWRGLKFGHRAPGQGRAVCAAIAAASLLASTTLAPVMAADVGTLLSPAVLARASGTSSSPTGQSLLTPSPALQTQLALSAASLARAAKDLSNIAAAQAAASASSQLTLGNVALSGSSWNGSSLSGLNPRDSDRTLWINADPLQKDAASATATVKQTAATALLTWQSLDLNKGEKLVFDQQNNADWTVLNRIVAGPRDASGSRLVASPSMILGSIQAPGSVYVINPNGVVFGPNAQVNVHSFIASSLDVGAPTMSTGERNSFFLNTGILGGGGGVPAESFSYNPNDRQVEGDITVEAGANITANLAPRSVSPDAGGFVYLFAPNVENRGTIIAPAGEILMVAAQAVQLIANAYPDGVPREDAAVASSTFRAVGVNTILTGGQIQNGGEITDSPIIWRTDGPASAQISSPGKVTNSGLLNAERGVVILNGDLVTNGSSSGPGVIRANTSITRNGQIYLDARLQLTLAGGSIQILPTENGETIPDSAVGNFAPGSVEMRGEVIDIESGALIEAPGAAVSISGINLPHGIGIYPDKIGAVIADQYFPRIYMASDSAIDVSGLQNVTRPMSDNFLTFKPFGNEFADQPLQRNGALRGQQLTVDLRQSGTLNGANWIGTPLANLAGYATGVPRTIDQLLTTGGNVTLSSPADGQIVLRQGSAINVGGGSVQYAGDSISATKLLTADGRIVSMSRADPLDSYIGIAGVYELQHPHWGNTTTETFVAPLLSGAAPEPGYSEGHDAGAINLVASAYVLDGDLYGGVTAGDRQRALGQRPSSGDGALAMPSAGSLTLSGVNNLTLSANVTPLAGNFAVLTPLASGVLQTTAISTQKLSDAGFANISANFSGDLKVTRDANLVVASGGMIVLSGGSADIEGSLVAHSGTISVDSTAHISGDTLGNPGTAYKPTSPARSNTFDLLIGSTALLDASGVWVNDSGAAPADLTGGAFIDGGSVTLKTEARSAVCATSGCKTLPGLGAGVPANVDITGDIVLAQGASLDTSSGGRITDRGVMMLDSKGRAAGKGGNIALETYAGGFSTAGSPPPVTTTGLTATLRLSGSDGSAEGNAAALVQTLQAYGFAQGGTLTLQAPSFDIGTVGPAALGTLALPADFFDGNGFGAYNLVAKVDHLSVAPNTALVLRQRNFVPGSDLATLPSGAKVSQVATVDYLSDFLRQPVNLTLSATVPIIPAGPYDPATPVAPFRTLLSIGQGASIKGEAGAKIAIGVAGRSLWVSDGSGFGPPIAAQAAVAEILGSISAPGGSIQLTAGQNSRLWLGADSRLDVSGVALTDTRQSLFRTGTVLPGGSVTITATDATAAVIGLHGALIDVSGSSGTFDLLADSKLTLAGQQRVATAIWSDAGSIAISAPTLLYDGAFAAHAGAAAGNGGSLTIVSPEVNGAGSEKITVRQSGNAVPVGLNPTDSLGALTGLAAVFADRLDGSGIQDLTLSMGPITGDAVSSSQGKFAPGTLIFSGNVSLGGVKELFLDASQVSLINTVAPSDPRGCNVCLDAGTVALRGAGNVNRIFPQAGTGVLRVAADTIDIAAGGFSLPDGSNLLAISGAARSNFVSTGDIRLRVPLANVSLDLVPGTLPAGELISAGDITLDAAQIYPISGVDFTLKSTAPGGTIRFAANDAPRSAPLSAGGQVTVSAAHIDQAGVLLAPLGTIRLGAQSSTDLSPNDPTANTVVATQTVIFGAGSITSISLAGQTVPFGQTANGTSWSYDSFTGRPLTAPPAKDLIVSAAVIDLAKGATLDLQGGGDIQATEFVPGTGGTRDVLANSGNVYAIIPGYDPATAPIDLDFLLQRRDGLPLAGSRVYLSGEAGVPAGIYTLLPAHYATLPGAYRVMRVNNSTDALSYLNNSLPDGTLRMAGYFVNSASVTRDARLQYFDVQSAAVWRQYSEIDQSSGNSFFGAKTSGTSGLPPRLPIDAGHAVFSGLNAIGLQGKILAAPSALGRGGEFDIGAQDIQILSPGAAARSGYVGLDATQLSNLGIDSLLLGGIRSDSADGQSVTVVSNSVEVSNDANAPLEGPEVILVTRVGSNSSDPNASRGLMLDAGSVVRAKGSVVNPAQKKITIGSDALKIAGNGSLLAVSNGSVLAVERQRSTQNNGLITLAGPAKGVAGPGASVRANSLTLDTSGNIRPGTGVTLSATNIFVAAKSINFGTTQGNAGLNINGGIADQLELASNLTLRSARTIDFSGPVDFSLGAGSHLILDTSALVSVTGTGTVRLGADGIDLVNSGSGQNPTAAGNAVFNLVASEVDLGAGSKSLSGFASAGISASSLIALHGTGSLDGGSAVLSFQALLVLVGSDADQTVTTSGDVSLAGTGTPTPVQQGQVGGSVALTGRAVTLAANTNLQATAGGVTLTATSGDITVGANAKIRANGFVSTFFDVTQSVGGGSVQLVADQGSIDIDPTALIDVSSAAGQPGSAGQIGLSAANGDILSKGAAFDMAAISGTVVGDSGGRLTIDAQSLGSTSLALPGMLDASIDVHLRRGDVQLASDIKARAVAVTADGGILTVARTVDTSGSKGGSISLFGQAGVVLTPNARLLATASDTAKRGGDILIGTGTSGVLDLQGGVIDVSNTANSANGGTVRLRAPLIGATNYDVAINRVGTAIQGASSVTVEGYRVFNTRNSAFQGVIDPLALPGFFGSCNTVGVCSGTLIDFVQTFALSAAAQSKFATLSSATLHLQPGIELVNDDLSVNNGDITVANAWNLGSGIAGYLVSGVDPKHVVPPGTVITDANGNLLPQYAAYKGNLVFAPGVSQIRSLYYRVGGSLTGEAGALTLRAARDVNINDSITDGFFNTRNVFDTTYQKNLTSWTNSIYSLGNSTTDVSNVGGYIIAGATYAVSAAGPAPQAPYDALANGISPNFSAQDKTPISDADLFSLVRDPSGSIQDDQGTRYSAVNSWSYRIVSGADTASANPLAVRPLSVFNPAGVSSLAGHGNVVIDGHTQFNVTSNPANNLPGTFFNIAYVTPTIVRTGTGFIDIAAGLDFILADQKAPGVVYTAGRSSVDLPDPGFVVQTITDPFDSTQQIPMPFATNPQGFLTPQVLSCDLNFECNPYGPATQAAYPVGGGHLTLTAQRDIIGFENTTLARPGLGAIPNQQYFAPWLLAQGTALSVVDFGPFSPLSGYLSSGGLPFTPSQTSWWINFGSFDQGLMSVGGDVTVKAGRDIQELSVSLPTTARVSGGLSSTFVDANGKTVANIPVLHLNGSGDLTVQAGRDLKSGAYYEGSGDAVILVGGSISASWAIRPDPTVPLDTHLVSTILAVDTGKIALQARGSIDIGGIVSGASLQNVADPGQAFDVLSQSVSSYGPSSAVSLLSVGGDIITNSLSFDALNYNIALVDWQLDTTGYPGVSRYPVSFSAVAANGDVNVSGSFRLASSQSGTLNLLAHGSLLTSSSTINIGAQRPMSTGASLVEQAFDAVNPLAGFAPGQGSVSFDLGSLLLHQDDSVLDRFYAATGDIIANGSVSTSPFAIPLAWEITKPAKVRAAGDIIDLSFFGQNLAPTDVTTIVAGRDIFYTGAWQQLLGTNAGIPDLNETQNQGGLSLAGPGFFKVEAGRNLGPFVTAAADITAGLAGGPESDPVGTGIVTFGNTVVVGNRRMFSSENPITADPFAMGANNKLARQGADIVALFGVANGIDYAAVIRNYVDPATSTSGRDYVPALGTYLQSLGFGAMSKADAWASFKALPADLQQIFADKVFVNELKLVGQADGCCYQDYSVGYSIINTLFPAALGYTDNYRDMDTPAQDITGLSDDELVRTAIALAHRANSSGAGVDLKEADLRSLSRENLLSVTLKYLRPTLRPTGELDLLHATIKTLQSASTKITNADGTASAIQVGGDVLVMGPGGSINVGTTALEINHKLSNSSLGVLTLDNGAINIFTDANVLVNQSRILTVQGGDILMLSSNGNLDAGRGAKTTVDFKPLSVNFDPSDFQTINLNGLVSGAGIGTIRSTPDAPAASAVIIAPRGVINAGDAGLRSSGSISLVALQVLNAANISSVGAVSNSTSVQGPSIGDLTSTSSTAGQAANAAEDAAAAAGRGAQTGGRALPSLITVEVLGFGDCDPEGGRSCPTN